MSASDSDSLRLLRSVTFASSGGKCLYSGILNMRSINHHNFVDEFYKAQKLSAHLPNCAYNPFCRKRVHNFYLILKGILPSY